MGDINSLYEAYTANNKIDPKYYEKFNVKRGLRNPDGSGVMAGVTNICNVHGYVINEGEKSPDEGKLVFRGYNINDLVSNVVAENRFGYEEIAYLLLGGKLPTEHQLENFRELLDNNRELPEGFFEDMILKAPSKNIMNKMSRAVLALYSYDDVPDNTEVKHEVDTAVSIIAKMPVIMVSAYHVKQRYYNHKSMFMHPLIPGQSTAETILSMLRPDRQFTDEEAKLLDVMLMLHAEHGGGNNSTFTCRVLTSSGTDPYAAYSAAIGSLKGPRLGRFPEEDPPQGSRRRHRTYLRYGSCGIYPFRPQSRYPEAERSKNGYRQRVRGRIPSAGDDRAPYSRAFQGSKGRREEDVCQRGYVQRLCLQDAGHSRGSVHTSLCRFQNGRLVRSPL